VVVVGHGRGAIEQALGLSECRKDSSVAHLVAIERELIAKLSSSFDSSFALIRTHKSANQHATAANRQCRGSKCTHDPSDVFSVPVEARPSQGPQAPQSTPLPFIDTDDRVPAHTTSSSTTGLPLASKRVFSAEELMELRAGPVHLSIPPEAAAQWSVLVEGALNAIFSSPNVDAAPAFSRLLALPSIFLPEYVHEKKILGHLLCPSTTVRAPFASQGPGDAEDRRLKAAVRAGEKGFLKKANALLSGTKPVEVDERVFGMLMRKYPSGPPAEPPRRMEFDVPSLCGESVQRVLKKMEPASSSGLDRWTPALLHAACSRPAVAALVTRLLDLLLARPSLFWEYTSYTRGFAVSKGENGAGEVEDVRPIGVSTFFIKLLGSCILDSEKPQNTLPVWQKGFAKHGCQLVASRLRRAHRTGKYILTTDVKNAYNACDRRLAETILSKDEFLRMKSYFYLLYGVESTVLYQNGKKIKSNTGFHQGNPVSSWMFDACFAHVLDPVFAAFPEGITSLAIHDDLSTITTTAKEAFEALGLITQAIGIAELEVQRKKCELLLPRNCTCEEVAEAKRIFGDSVTIVDPHSRKRRKEQLVTDKTTCSIKVVGAHIGATEGCTEFANKCVDEALEVVERCKKVGAINTRLAINMMKYCGQSKLFYRCAVLPPEATKVAMTRFDDGVTKAVEELLDIEPLDFRRKCLLFSPLGFDLTALESAAQPLYDYYESGAAFAPRQAPAHGSPSGNRNKDIDDGPLSGVRQAASSTALGLFPSHRVRLLGSSSSSSTAWPSPFMSNLPCTASPSDVRLLLRAKLLLDPPFPPCLCGRVDAGDSSHLEHIITCSRVLAPNATFRHNTVMAALAYSLQRFSLVVATEPRFYNYEDGTRKRPDITVFGHPGTTTDITIAAEVEAAAAAKTAKHGAAAAGRHHNFIPFVLSIWGSAHGSVDQFLKTVLKEVSPHTRKIAFLEIKRAVAEAWAIGTAGVINGTITRNLSDVSPLSDFTGSFLAA
jgi:hypothetical protein